MTSPCRCIKNSIYFLLLLIPLSSTRAEEGFDELLRKTEEVRQLAFKTPVPFERLARERLSTFLAAEVSKQYREDDWRNIRDSFALLGAVPKDLDLQEFYNGLLAEQVAGLYDPHSKKMLVVGNLTVEAALTRVILEHELTHAVTDQHFDLLGLPIEDKSNDDRALAALALVEGDATLSMLVYAKDLGLGDLLVTAAATLFMDQDRLTAAPPIFQGLLLFPYLAGELFLVDLAERHDLRNGALVSSEEGVEEIDFDEWDLVNYVYSHPPQSTEQILHPEKLYEHLDPPQEAIIGDGLLDPFGEEWKEAWRNTFGEFLIKTLLLEHMPAHVAESAAQGWGGDRYLLARGTTGETVLFWRTLWDTDKDAGEFREAIEKGAAAGMFGGTPVLLPLSSSPPHNEVALWIVSNPSLVDLVTQESKL